MLANYRRSDSAAVLGSAFAVLGQHAFDTGVRPELRDALVAKALEVRSSILRSDSSLTAKQTAGETIDTLGAAVTLSPTQPTNAPAAPVETPTVMAAGTSGFGSRPDAVLYVRGNKGLDA